MKGLDAKETEDMGKLPNQPSRIDATKGKLETVGCLHWLFRMPIRFAFGGAVIGAGGATVIASAANSLLWTAIAATVGFLVGAVVGLMCYLTVRFGIDLF
jgi:hypothetical protein